MSTSKRPSPLFDWFIPIDGDGQHIGTRRAERPPTFDYLRKVVDAAEGNGFHSLLIPTRFVNGLFEESAPLSETWTTVAALAAVTSRIRFLVAVRPGFISAGLFAQMAATLDQISGGRLDINVVPGGIQGDFERVGEKIDHHTRYARAEEFIESLRLLWESPLPTTFNGQYVSLEDAVVSPGVFNGGPQFYLGGASSDALQLAGRQADVYLAWIHTKENIASFIERANAKFSEAGRPARYGLRTHLVVRDTEAAAWDAAEELIARADPEVHRQRQAVTSSSQMVGQKAQAQVAKDHLLAPNLWNGISTVRVNCGTALVGTPDQVAAELRDYWRLGIDEFILSGYPHIEECDRAATDLLPATLSLIQEEDSLDA